MIATPWSQMLSANHPKPVVARSEFGQMKGDKKVEQLTSRNKELPLMEGSECRSA